jgi:Anti-sigma regulatory factor (Ser/Thr protein kinase)
MSAMRLSYPVRGGDLLGAGEASAATKVALRKLGLDAETIRRISICMYEGEINMVIHAEGGEIDVDIDLDKVTLTLRDRGPGIPDIEKAMQEGYSTAGTEARDLGFGAGMGLPNMKRYADGIQIETKLGVGTTVTMHVNVK